MESRLTGPAPDPDSKREKDFQEGTLILMLTYNVQNNVCNMSGSVVPPQSIKFFICLV